MTAADGWPATNSTAKVGPDSTAKPASHGALAPSSKTTSLILAMLSVSTPLAAETMTCRSRFARKSKSRRDHIAESVGRHDREHAIQIGQGFELRGNFDLCRQHRVAEIALVSTFPSQSLGDVFVARPQSHRSAVAGVVNRQGTAPGAGAENTEPTQLRFLSPRRVSLCVSSLWILERWPQMTSAAMAPDAAGSQASAALDAPWLEASTA